MGLKVCIVGLAPGRCIPEGYETWGLAWDAERYEFDRVFEMHDWDDLLRTYERLGTYLEKLDAVDRLYMAGAYLPNATVYPFDEVAESVGDYWCSSIAYMLALAIHEQAEEILLAGVTASDDYGYQRPNLEYLIGFARGRGIKVTTSLCEFVNPPDREYDGRYGKS